MNAESFVRALQDPLRAIRVVADRLAPRGASTSEAAAPRDPAALLEALSRKSGALGIRGINIVMSFDCDTPDDAAAADTIFEELTGRGIPATFAVPGATLEATARHYQRIAAAGARFMNHGYRPHSEFRDGRYLGITFYEQLANSEVVEDIRAGHAAVSRVVGTPPAGFRGPHFGSFQLPEHRALVYRVAGELGYRFCSDTLPVRAYESGPVFRVGEGLSELPLTGSLREPMVILDSWNYLADRSHYRMRGDYADRFAETVDFFATRDAPVLLNYYADPAHIAADGVFLQALDHALDAGVRFRSFEDVLNLTSGR